MPSGTHASCFFALLSSLAIWAAVALDIRRRSRDSLRFANIRDTHGRN